MLQYVSDELRMPPLPRRFEEELAVPVPEAETDPAAQLFVSAAKGLGFDAFDVGATLFPVRPTTPGGADGGLALAPYAFGTSETSFPLADTVSLVLSASTADDLAGGVVLLLRPGAEPELRTGMFGAPGGGPEVGFTLSVRSVAPAGGRTVLFSAPAVTIDAAAVSAGIGVTAGAGLDPALRLSIEDCRVRVAPPAADGFLASILPADGVTATMRLDVSWSSRGGLHIDGGAGLRATFPLHTRAGSVQLDTVDLALTAGPDAVRLVAAVTGATVLGPFSAVVESVGAAAELRFERGNLGMVDLGARVLPPAGVGLSIDSPVVSGGGFLRFDPAAGRYAGVFELTLADTVAVKAIALLTTRRPDGGPGYALLVMITAEGFTPIPLGLGFTLTGIGGLLALNRTVEADAVRSGLRDGVLDSVLFVTDPIRNADRVLSTLDRIFPRAADRLVVGPLAEISWGSPTIVTLRVALLLELPQPVRAVLLAALTVVLPRPDDPVVELHVDAIGVVDLAKGELALDASLHDSRILGYPLTGDMALRLRWGQQPTFLMSLGGFHPRFPAPAGIRPLGRLALSLTDGQNPRVRFEAYLALTSNTIQLGARVSVYAESHGFGVDGGGSFDALVQWSPFAVDVSMAVWVRVFSPAGALLAVSIGLQVTGPRPWHLTGQASVSVLWWTVKVPVDIRLGAPPAAPEPVQTVDVAALLWEQVADRANWQGTLPPSVPPGATLAYPGANAAGAPLVVHPFATVTMRQRIVPLGTTVTHIGARLPTEGARSYRLAVTAPAGVRSAPADDLFALGQYVDLPDDARLTAPSFTALPAGVALSPAAATAAGPAFGCDLAFETLDVLDLDQPARAAAAVPAHPATALGPLADQGGRPGPRRTRRSGARIEAGLR